MAGADTQKVPSVSSARGLFIPPLSPNRVGISPSWSCPEPSRNIFGAPTPAAVDCHDNDGNGVGVGAART